MRIEFRQPSCFSDLRVLVDFLGKQNLGYPNYDDWVTRCLAELDAGYKQAIIAYDGSKIVGNVIFQPHKEISGVREIKNLRVAEDMRNRRFGAFLLRQAEWHDSASYHAIMADFRADQSEIEKLLLDEGFVIAGVRTLYDEKQDKIALRTNRYQK